MTDFIVKLLIVASLGVPVIAYGMPANAGIGFSVAHLADSSTEPADPLDSNAAFLRR